MLRECGPLRGIIGEEPELTVTSRKMPDQTSFSNALRVARVILLACSLPALPTALLAEAGQLTLSEVVQAGFERSPELGLSDTMRHQGQAIRKQASSLLADNPALMIRHENDTLGSDDGFRQWEGGLEMPMWLPGQRDRRGKVADLAEGEADAVRNLQIWRMAGQIRELLWSLYIAESERALARRALEKVKTLEADIAKRVAAGELARTDLILSQKEALAQEAVWVSADAAYEVLLQNYRLITALTNVPAQIDETKAGINTIGDAHPALVAARFASERMRAERDQVRGEKYANPLLFVGSKSEKSESGVSYDTALIVQVNVPLGTSVHAAPRTASAELRLSEAVSELATVRRELENNLIEATAELQRTAQAVDLTGRQQQLASEGMRLTRRSFELGESGVFMLLQAGVQALKSEHDLRISRLMQGRALSRYNQALGVIPE